MIPDLNWGYSAHSLEPGHEEGLVCTVCLKVEFLAVRCPVAETGFRYMEHHLSGGKGA